MIGYEHLRGSSRFDATTLINNWQEDRELQRSLLKDLLARKTTGTLKLDAYHQRMSVALQEVELTKVRDDPYVHFGDVIQLVHVDTGNVLACDVGDKDVRPGEEACTATAAPEIRAPCARNTLILQKYIPNRKSPLESYYTDDAVKYGEKVRLAVHPAATMNPVDAAGGPRPLCLFSKPVSTTHFAKYSRNQLVGFTYRDTFDTVWQIVTPDPSQRTVSEGVEVVAGAPILLVHCATQKPLMVERHKYPNDFGIELELSARASTSQGLKLAMEQTSTGIHKGTMPKPETQDNFWTIITGSKVQALPPPSNAMPEADQLLQAMVSELQSKQGAIPLLERKLVTLEDKNYELPADEVLLVLKQVGCSVNASDVELLIARFPGDRKHVLDCKAFLAAFRQLTGRETLRHVVGSLVK